MKLDDLIASVDKIAFEGPSKPERGYTMRASYLKEPYSGDALVEIFKDGQPVRRFAFPAYKIWNIAAHFTDLVDGIESPTVDNEPAKEGDDAK